MIENFISQKCNASGVPKKFHVYTWFDKISLFDLPLRILEELFILPKIYLGLLIQSQVHYDSIVWFTVVIWDLLGVF